VCRSTGLLLLVRLPVLLLFLALLAGCQTRREVAVRVSIPGLDSLETPASGIGVVALPYDRDSILASLAARARRPKPNTAALDSLFGNFRGPFVRYTSLSYAAGALRDSLQLLRGRLSATASASDDHQPLVARIRQLSDSLAALQSHTQQARRQLELARADFLRRSDSLRAAVRQWEDSTYQGYDSLVENLSRRMGREATTDTTDATGWAHFTLRPGRWWMYARAWDTGDPNGEWYWNILVESDTVLLSSRTGQRRPKY
jgi:hypothetical protein